jgi:predicted lipid carrier protein YhbT
MNANGPRGFRGDLIPQPLAKLIGLLPQWPPSAAVAAGLNLVLLPTLDAETRHRLANRAIAFQVPDAGIHCGVVLGLLGFVPFTRRRKAEVTIRASAVDFYRLALRMDDPDTLFFARRLVIEGDTELGLCLKNALDAIDWAQLLATRFAKRIWSARPFAGGPHSRSTSRYQNA